MDSPFFFSLLLPVWRWWWCFAFRGGIVPTWFRSWIGSAISFDWGWNLGKTQIHSIRELGKNLTPLLWFKLNHSRGQLHFISFYRAPLLDLFQFKKSYPTRELSCPHSFIDPFNLNNSTRELGFSLLPTWLDFTHCIGCPFKKNHSTMGFGPLPVLLNVFELFWVNYALQSA